MPAPALERDDGEDGALALEDQPPQPDDDCDDDSAPALADQEDKEGSGSEEAHSQEAEAAEAARRPDADEAARLAESETPDDAFYQRVLRDSKVANFSWGAMRFMLHRRGNSAKFDW